MKVFQESLILTYLNLLVERSFDKLYNKFSSINWLEKYIL